MAKGTVVNLSGIGIVRPMGAEPIPWPLREHATSRMYRPIPTPGYDPGPSRWAAVWMHAARFAIIDQRGRVAPGERGPVLFASCNGGAAIGTEAAWQTTFGNRLVVSAACASGIHALYLARAMIDAGEREVIVVACDLATPPSHDNFEALRVLTDTPAPYQADAAGFQLGDAAVALRLVRDGTGPRLIGPVLGHDLDGDDGLVRCLGALADTSTARIHVDLVIGQGTGPASVDAVELAALARFVAPDTWLATALATCGHTLGASSLLSVALAAQVVDGANPTELAMPHATALDGRPLGPRPARRVLAACRALGGACGAAIVGDGELTRPAPIWGPRTPAPPLRHPLLRALATAPRPSEPIDLLIVTLDVPLPPAARINGRILPASVLEMTPGFIPQLVARAWGHRGPAVCLVGGDPAPVIAACRATHERVYVLAIRGTDERDVEWNAR